MEERLEHAEIVVFPSCPFSLPEGDDRHFLFCQRESGWPHKNISLNPITGRLQGFRYESAQQEARLRYLLADFGGRAASWLSQTLPRYANNWQRERVSFRTEEEATRRARLTARNDLLHIDAFPSRPTQGYRILRLFVNLHPTDPRVWITSEPFVSLLARFGHQIGFPNPGNLGWTRRWQQKIFGLFQPGRQRRTVYDQFMLSFHHFLKANDEFQERGPKRFWHFPPMSLWLAFTDAVSHADLRGKFLLEHTFFVSPQDLLFPELAPAAVLQRFSNLPVFQKAA